MKTETLALLEQYLEFLWRWNRIHNLSGAKTKEALWQNIQNSLEPLSIEGLGEQIQKKNLLLDIGSGNGFPAIPLGIALKIPTFLCEPNAKKVSFLQNCKAELNLKNFTILPQKIEEVTLQSLPDLITSRAVMSITTLLNKTKRILQSQSLLVFYKGSQVIKEIPSNCVYEIYQKDLRKYFVIQGATLCNG